jgi:protein-tyrosine phosphatase
MDFIAKVNEQIYFGKYPDEDILEALKELKVKLIIDLTHFTDNLPKYHSIKDIKRIEFPIVDMGIQEDDLTLQYVMFIKSLFLNGDNPIYIHCKGGHGRSGVITCLLYGMLYDKTAEESLEAIKEAHDNRKQMSRRMRIIGSPQTPNQKLQVIRLLSKEA